MLGAALRGSWPGVVSRRDGSAVSAGGEFQVASGRKRIGPEALLREEGRIGLKGFLRKVQSILQALLGANRTVLEKSRRGLPRDAWNRNLPSNRNSHKALTVLHMVGRINAC